MGGDPSHVIRYFVAGSMGDGIRDELSSLLNPKQVFHYTDSTIGRHYGFVLVEIFADPGDPARGKRRSGKCGSIQPGPATARSTRWAVITMTQTLLRITRQRGRRHDDDSLRRW